MLKKDKKVVGVRGRGVSQMSSAESCWARQGWPYEDQNTHLQFLQSMINSEYWGLTPKCFLSSKYNFRQFLFSFNSGFLLRTNWTSAAVKCACTNSLQILFSDTIYFIVGVVLPAFSTSRWSESLQRISLTHSSGSWSMVVSSFIFFNSNSFLLFSTTVMQAILVLVFLCFLIRVSLPRWPPQTVLSSSIAWRSVRNLSRMCSLVCDSYTVFAISSKSLKINIWLAPDNW